jgi:ribokinase
MHSYDWISIGDTMQDVFLQMSTDDVHLYDAPNLPQQMGLNFADKIPVQRKDDLIGGNSANAAIAMARLGYRTAIYSHVGEDAQGVRIKEEFTKNNVSTEYVVVDHGLESNYNTVINLNGERTILIYHVHRHFRLPKMASSEWVYLSSMGQGFEVILPQVCAYLDKTDAKLVYQPGTYQLRSGAETAKELLKRTEIFAVNREEAELYLGKPAGTPFRELLDGVCGLGVKIALITDGPNGAYASDGVSYYYLGIIKAAPRIEATGAGDSFTSAFSAAIAAGESIQEALRWGQCEASQVIQHIGPQPGLVNRRKMAHLLAEHHELQAVPLEDGDMSHRFDV